MTEKNDGGIQTLQIVKIYLFELNPFQGCLKKLVLNKYLSNPRNRI